MRKFSTRKISETMTLIKIGEREIVLLGTAHISAESLAEVGKTIEIKAPDHVCVEVDEDRLKNLDDESKWSRTDVRNILKRRQGFMLLANLALSSFQRRMGLKIGVRPGAEMKAAVDAARKRNIGFSCCDRSIQVTLSRAWRLSSFWSKLKLISSLLTSILVNEKADPVEIEKLKEADAMQGIMNELASYLPAIKKVLIDERDFYLASKIVSSPGRKTLAVVGAAHARGIVRVMGEIVANERSPETEDLEIVPLRKWYGRVLPWIIPLLIIGLFAFGIYRSGFGKMLEMGKIWIFANGVLAAVGALAALAHPLTVLISFVGAPITSLSPTIGVGMVAGLLEYMFRTPRVADMENLKSDLLGIRGWYRNRVTRILMVFLLSSVGSIVGFFIAIPWLTSIAGG